ncbi:hypothetical protein [Acidisoma sp. S159]|uniref:hypothetical protein n=1 Tax=Acidisoma sp. S159 TaxID=1747225 RepID=UPI00131ADBC6|nr:hypothetical protein [Acidisoma sp. S159]
MLYGRLGHPVADRRGRGDDEAGDETTDYARQRRIHAGRDDNDGKPGDLLRPA